MLEPLGITGMICGRRVSGASFASRGLRGCLSLAGAASSVIVPLAGYRGERLADDDAELPANARFRLGQRDLQDAVSIDGVQLFRVNFRGQQNVALEDAV